MIPLFLPESPVWLVCADFLAPLLLAVNDNDIPLEAA